MHLMVAYSPEREDPNNQKYSTSTITKVVGGIDETSLDCALALYDTIICETVPVSSCRAAEATKLMENIFRCVNIALVNELKTVLAAMDIDVWEVIEAAKTKPFGYMPFYPGPGLGGHCIPIDPFYLTWKAREYGMNTRFIELAGEINTRMPWEVVLKTTLEANKRGISMSGAKVLLVGLAYKGNIDDDRESPTYALWEYFEKVGAEVSYYDPLCPEVRHSPQNENFIGRESIPWEDLCKFDIAVISTAHDCVDHDLIPNVVPLVVDTRNACEAAHNVVKA
jgi:UDP-N-acetyl-D-glucosamine dehydrogenase